MNSLDIRPIIRAVLETVKGHELPQKGAYCRWTIQNDEGTRWLGANEYGCADAINILYTLNEFQCDEETRLARLSVLQSMQDKDSGYFRESTHNVIHTTAHCAAAIELMDARPLYPIRALHPYLSPEGIRNFLEDQVDWSSPWPESHKGAGIYAALVNSAEMNREVEDSYFGWLYENTDHETGFWIAGMANRAPYNSDENQFGGGEPTSMYTYMAGGFHFIFNHEYAKRPLRYPDRIIDTCLKMYKESKIRRDFGKMIGFLELDWVYCLNRASRQTPHRFEEVKATLYDFAVKHIGYLNGLCSSGEYKRNLRFDDLHMLFGCVCGLAELQEALPGLIISEKPLRLVLNRRPFV